MGDGRRADHWTCRQAGASADRTVLDADGRDLAFVAVTIVDQDGQKVPTAGNLIRFSVRGPGAIAAVGNGDPTNHRSFQSDQYEAFHGQCSSSSDPPQGKAVQSISRPSRKGCPAVGLW